MIIFRKGQNHSVLINLFVVWIIVHYWFPKSYWKHFRLTKKDPFWNSSLYLGPFEFYWDRRRQFDQERIRLLYRFAIIDWHFVVWKEYWQFNEIIKAEVIFSTAKLLDSIKI
jgi:hypothetical protein